MPQYTTVILPPQHIIESVAQLKQGLHDTIGWYHSCNSLAHITINLFVSSEKAFQIREDYIKHFASQLLPFSIGFDHTGIFSNGAFVILPDEVSRIRLSSMMKDFHNGVPGNVFGKSLNPHISIG